MLFWKHSAFRPCPVPDESNHPLSETLFIILYSYEGIRHSPGPGAVFRYMLDSYFEGFGGSGLNLFYYIHIFIMNSTLKEFIPPSKPKANGTLSQLSLLFVP